MNSPPYALTPTWYNILPISLLLSLGLLLNLSLFLTTLLTPHLKTINSAFLCHVAFAGLLASSTLPSLALVGLCGGLEGVQRDRVCVGEQVVGVFCMSAMSMVLLLFGFYRFMSAVKPLATLVHVRLNTTRLLLLIPWVIAAFYSFLVNVDQSAGSCVERDWSSVQGPVFVGLFVVVLVVPGGLQTMFFIAILCRYREKRRHAAKVRVRSVLWNLLKCAAFFHNNLL